ncbi:MAG: 4-alpha-glucanotransferase [Bacteroidales bacterium]|nr:4-alpha-glucanotransferase [Bacteroidales bacterium]MDZ4205277.1 4-alpha-glucanotransferase [Bacteroidales bacterium]
MKLDRSSGILLHITSLPGKFGIGNFGEGAYHFIDYLIAARQSVWQLLPLGHTGYGDSPYQCYSAFAGNPLLIDLELLKKEGFLEASDLKTSQTFSTCEVEFGKVSEFVYPLLKKAALAFLASASLVERTKFEVFCYKNSYWLGDYAFFMAVKQLYGGKPWWQWDKEIRLRIGTSVDQLGQELETQVNIWKLTQFFFFDQWSALKSYANRNGIKIVGDIPLYVAHDSADTWCHPEMFWFDEVRNPVRVAGVPPDYFSETGQLWGNPLYNWAKLQEDGFDWWIERIKANFSLYDILRIDHFRGLAAYWAVPFGEKTAINGEWLPAPGKDLLETIKKTLGVLPIIAEDLGVITPDVEELRDSNHFPGMKILQFAFDSEEENDFLPHTYPRNCIVYTGTHDNDTSVGWYQASKEQDKQVISEYFNPDENDISWAFIKLAWSSVADLAIAPLQDVLRLGTDARMNLPGKPSGYWKWRYRAEHLTVEHALKLRKLTKIFGRI